MTEYLKRLGDAVGEAKRSHVQTQLEMERQMRRSTELRSRVMRAMRKVEVARAMGLGGNGEGEREWRHRLARLENAVEMIGSSVRDVKGAAVRHREKTQTPPDSSNDNLGERDKEIIHKILTTQQEGLRKMREVVERDRIFVGVIKGAQGR